MKSWIFLIFFTVLYYNIPNTDGTCVLPADLRGAWVDTFKGELEINDHTITGYQFHTFGILTLTCYEQDDSVYVFESSEFLYFGLNFTVYFCWNFTQVNNDMFYFYEYAPVVAEAGYEKVKVYLPTLNRVYSEICAHTDAGLGTYRIMFRNGTIENAITDCPSDINGYYKYDVRDDTGTSTCNSSSNALDACGNSTQLTYNGTECDIPLAYSTSGSVFCLFNVQDKANKLHYVSLYNPGDVDDSTTYMITCMILDYSSSSLRGVQHPKICPDRMNKTYTFSPGAYVYLNSPSSCSPSSTFPWWIIGLVIGILFLIAIIIILLYYRKKKHDEEERKRRLLQEEDDERFDPEKFARGDRPPFVSITIMGDGSRRDKNGNLIPDEPPQIKRPKSEGGKRRLDKRVRVWVVGKDGQVKKVWKEVGESPDSGLEDDEVDGQGGGSTGRKTLTSSATSEKEADDMEFAKKHGRKELKSAREIEEKGEKDKSSAKLMRRMKGMASSRRSARFRKSARSGRRTGRSKKSTLSRDDDGERSWGSDEGDYEEVDLERVQEMDDNAMNEEREKLGDDIVKPSKDQLEVVPVAAVAVVSETGAKEEGGKGRKGKKDKGKQKAGKGSAKKKKEATSGKESKEKKDEEQQHDGGQPSVSGAAATAAVVDETQKKEKETSKKPQDKKETSKKKVESKQTRKATDKKVSPGKSVEQIEMEDKKGVKFKEGGGGELSQGETAAIGAGVATTAIAAAVIAAAADSDKSEKSEAQLKAERKKKEKEEAKKLKEEKKRLEKEAKEAKKTAEEDAKEKARALTRYASVDESKEGENVQTDVTKDEEIISTPKKEDMKSSGTDSGHVTPSSADDISKQETAPNTARQETAKTAGGEDSLEDKPPLPPPREPTLSSSLKPRREQSVLLELDNSRSGSAVMTEERRVSRTVSPGQGQKALGVVEELVDTARSKAEGLDTTLDESVVTSVPVVPVPVPLLDLGSRDNDSLKEATTPKSAGARGDETSGSEKKETDTEGKKKGGAAVNQQQHQQEEKKSKSGANTTDKKRQQEVQSGVQIIVYEADGKSKTDALKQHDTIQEEDDEYQSSSSESSGPELPEAARRGRKPAQGFMFMDSSNANSAFKQAGDRIHSMPVKKKTMGRRKPRAAPVDMSTTIPKHTAAAFGVSEKQKAKVTAVARVSTATKKPPSAAPKGPITIKDISKKSPSEVPQRSPGRDPILEGQQSSNKSGQSSNRSRDPKDRKTSEVEPGHHLQLMTRLMSLAEGDEGAEDGTPSRAQSSKSRQSRLERAEMSARARAEEAAMIDAEPSDSMDTPDALLTARQGPLVQGLPPTQHIYSRASSAGSRIRSGISRSHSDSRQAWLPGTDTTRTRQTHSSSSTTSEERFVRFKQGVMKQLEQLGDDEMNAIMYPRVQRYPEDGPGGPKRGTPAYRSMGTLQRIHRKNNKVGPLISDLPPIHGAYGRMIDDYDDADDPRLKVLLEELYKDKKYMDKTLRENPDDFLRSRTIQGRSYLLNRARFWSTQQPLVRPGTQAASRSNTAMPPPFPGEASYRTRSEERPGERQSDKD